MCAIEAGKRGRAVCVLEHNDRVGKKIAISGGGRCNFTNLHTQPEHFLSSNPAFCKSALARFTPYDFIALVEQHGIAYHEKKLGQQFCNTSSKSIIAMLLAECAAARVCIAIGRTVEGVQKRDRFEIAVNGGILTAQSLVVATGGLSFPQLGATPLGYDIARQFGLRLAEQRPGLVPLTFSDDDRKAFPDLSGLSIPCAVWCGAVCFAESVLITHRGWSGPAILQISSYWREGETIKLDLLPGENAGAWLGANRAGAERMASLLAQRLPKRFAEKWSGRFAPAHLGLPSDRWLADVGARLNRWEIKVAGTEGYARAEVTLGGVDTAELSSRTMEARRVPGLFFIGEVVDVTGWLGGYNFQWAWASGWAAGQVV